MLAVWEYEEDNWRSFLLRSRGTRERILICLQAREAEIFWTAIWPPL